MMMKIMMMKNKMKIMMIKVMKASRWKLMKKMKIQMK